MSDKINARDLRAAAREAIRTQGDNSNTKAISPTQQNHSNERNLSPFILSLQSYQRKCHHERLLRKQLSRFITSFSSKCVVLTSKRCKNIISQTPTSTTLLQNALLRAQNTLHNLCNLSLIHISEPTRPY